MPIEKYSQQRLPYLILVRTFVPTFAAFDTVNHSILLEVIENDFDITNIAPEMDISSYLKNGKFSVHIDDFSLNIKTINFAGHHGRI